MKSNNIQLLTYSLFCILLVFFIFQWGNYLIEHNYIKKYIVENFISYMVDTNTPLTSHTVNLPINTKTSCQNFCGPKSQCSITREQCTSDVDCYGCQPKPKPLPATLFADIRGQNDAGKLTINQNPQYSVLTTDIGTQASLYGPMLAKVPEPYLGVNVWRKSFNVGENKYRDKNMYLYSSDPSRFVNIPSYPKRETATGLFQDDGPLAANAYL